MPIYTKKGDRGETGLPGGRRLPKTDHVIEALGTIDELNASLGLIENKNLQNIQRDLLNIGAFIAGSRIKLKLGYRVRWLEKEIDKMTALMPTLSNFILPSGPIHLMRAIARRAERRVVGLQNDKIIMNSQILIYLNRLSDYLLTLARFENWKNGITEKVWTHTL